MRTVCSVFALLLVTLLPARAEADLVTLGFENLAAFDSVTDQFAANGVVFQGVTVLSDQPGGGLDIFEYAPRTGTNVLAADFSTVVIDFLAPVSSFAAYFTYSGPVAIFASLAGEPLLGSTVSLFDANTFSSGNPLNELMTFTGLFDQIQIVGAEFGAFTIDDLSFDTAARVPEPTTLALMVLGGAGVFLRRRRKA